MTDCKHGIVHSKGICLSCKLPVIKDNDGVWNDGDVETVEAPLTLIDDAIELLEYYYSVEGQPTYFECEAASVEDTIRGLKEL